MEECDEVTHSDVNCHSFWCEQDSHGGAVALQCADDARRHLQALGDLRVVAGGRRRGPTGVGEMYLPCRATAHLPIDSCYRK